MNIVTGVFDTVHNAEDAMQALLDAGFDAGDIGFATRDRSKGEWLARELGRDYRWPSGDEFTGRDAVYDRLPMFLLETMRRSTQGEAAASWYRDRFDEGRILLLVNAGDRADDAARIMRTGHGVLHHEHRERRTEYDVPQPEVREDMRIERRPLDRPQPPDAYQPRTASEDEIRVPVIQEELIIERRPIVREELVITFPPRRSREEEPPEDQQRPAA